MAPWYKPHQLILDALDDLELQEKNPLVTIDMNTWHDSIGPQANGRGEICSQCFAGVVMAQRFDCSRGDFWTPSNFRGGEEQCFLFLDNLRSLRPELALLDFNLETDVWDEAREAVRALSVPLNYASCPREFKAAMRDIAEALTPVFENYEPTRTQPWEEAGASE